MSSLREKLALNGFESNESYDFQIRCLLSYKPELVRALNIESDGVRRATAFATALAHSLDGEQIVYHDFTQENDPLPTVTRPESKDEDGNQEPPIDAFDRTMSDACAFSEGSQTIVILDQLHAADFREHIRIYKFIKKREWTYRDASFYANANNLLLFLISTEPLYHSLQKASFRIWISKASLGNKRFKPAEFGLGPDAELVMQRMGDLFTHLGVQPTFSEYARLLHDIQQNVRTAQELCYSVYGWTEGIDRELLYAPQTLELVNNIMPTLEEFVGIDHMEISGVDFPVDDPID